MRLAICVAIMLLTLPQAGQAQDTFNSNSGKAPCKTWQERLGPCYANDPQPGPSDEPAQGKGGGVLLKGGVSVRERLANVHSIVQPENRTFVMWKSSVAAFLRP
jgi:hypothetical protein